MAYWHSKSNHSDGFLCRCLGSVFRLSSLHVNCIGFLLSVQDLQDLFFLRRDILLYHFFALKLDEPVTPIIYYAKSNLALIR